MTATYAAGIPVRPGTSRRRFDVVAGGVTPTPVAAAITVVGDRYPEAMQRMIDR